MASRKHEEVIRAWLDGAEVEYKSVYGDWRPTDDPVFGENLEYRVKPEPIVRLDDVYLNEKEAALLYGMLNIAAAEAAIEHNCASIPTGMVQITRRDSGTVHYSLYQKMRNVIRKQLDLPTLP